ncbi:unnamed protein product [Meganyctiphanes norvegica]|uniref:Uncharacterized protein n=1 Tax=Meganyctiphanes norvegica TaxID=48144 RepID=A0AAV2QMM7_MEGNR
MASHNDTTTTMVLVAAAIVAVLCHAAAARPQQQDTFKPSRLLNHNEPGFFGARDAIIGFSRDGRSFDSGVVPSQLTEEFKGEIITGSSLDVSEASGDGTHVVRGSYSIGLPQGVKQTFIKYKETPGLFARPLNGKTDFKKSTGNGKIIYGTHKERPLSPNSNYTSSLLLAQEPLRLNDMPALTNPFRNLLFTDHLITANQSLFRNKRQTSRIRILHNVKAIRSIPRQL